MSTNHFGNQAFGDKKVHIIGYPFAGGQGKSGPELSPGWLFR
jgi:hypothetical protein